MKDLLEAGQVLGREEMKKLMAGSGGQECNCIYCYDGLDTYMTTYYANNCDYNPNIFCQQKGWDSGNFGLC